MKKILIIVLALCLFVIPAMAQTQDNPTVANWEDLEEDFIATGYSGTFYTLNDYGIQLLIPGGLEPVELTDEQLEDGFVALFGTDDGSVYIPVTFRDLECETLPEVAEMALTGHEERQFGGFYKINGLDAILLYDGGTDHLIVVIPTSLDSHYLQVSITPISNEEINSLSGFIIGSIQPIPEE